MNHEIEDPEVVFYMATKRLLEMPPQWRIKAKKPEHWLNLIRRQKLAGEIWARREAMMTLDRQIADIRNDPDNRVPYSTTYDGLTKDAWSAVWNLTHNRRILDRQCQELSIYLRDLGGVPSGCDYQGTAPTIIPTSPPFNIPRKLWLMEGPLIPVAIKTWVIGGSVVFVLLFLACMAVEMYGG